MKKTGAEPVFVFYVASEGSVGSLFWCPQGSRAQQQDKKISLVDVSEIMVGKRQAAFKTPMAAGIKSSKCFSLQTEQMTLNLEAETNEHVLVWLFGLNAALAGSGRQIVDEELPKTPVGAPASGTDEKPRRFSVITSKQ